MKIIAGPCSIDQDNIKEALEIAKLPVYGVRCVGLKSTTSMGNGRFVGIDEEAYEKQGEKLPSVEMAKEIEKLGKVPAMEIMNPDRQLPHYDSFERLFIWSPAVNTLGWNIRAMSDYCKPGWIIGVKNGKWDGDIEMLQEGTPLTNMEKTWLNAKTFSKTENLVYIQRGVDMPNKGNFRYVPDHQSAIRIKKVSGKEVWFDPSHSFGEKFRDKLVALTTREISKKNVETGEYVYDGLLIEVGTSKTDTNQHITIEELKKLMDNVAKFREIKDK